MGANLISRDRLKLAAPIVPEKAVLGDQISVLKHRIWTERLRIGRVAIFQVNAPKVFKAAVLIVVVAAALAAAVIASVAGEDLLEEAALAGSGAAGSGAAGNI